MSTPYPGFWQLPANWACASLIKWCRAKHKLWLFCSDKKLLLWFQNCRLLMPKWYFTKNCVQRYFHSSYMCRSLCCSHRLLTIAPLQPLKNIIFSTKFFLNLAVRWHSSSLQSEIRTRLSSVGINLYTGPKLFFPPKTTNLSILYSSVVFCFGDACWWCLLMLRHWPNSLLFWCIILTTWCYSSVTSRFYDIIISHIQVCKMLQLPLCFSKIWQKSLCRPPPSEPWWNLS